MTERLFNRQVIVEIGVPGERFRRFEGLTVNARVKKGVESSPNTAEIEVFNVKQESIALAQRDGAAVRLFAGYSIPRLVFAGPINRDGASQQKQGPTRILTLEAQDGGSRYRNARVNLTFDRGTSYRDLFQELANLTGFPLGSVEVPPGSLSQPVTLIGAVRDVLDRLAVTLSAEWSIQDGTLQFLPQGKGLPDQAILVSSQPGFRNLIGSPAPGKDGLDVRALLDGRFLPGRRIRLESERYQGIYRIVQVEHLISSGKDQVFYSDLVCREA